MGLLDNLLSNIEYFTGIPVYTKKQLDDLYYIIKTKIRPILEKKLIEKSRLESLGKNVKVSCELTRLDIFEPPQWSDAWNYEKGLCYGINIMEELFAVLQAHDVRSSDGVDFDGLRKMQRELIEEYNRVKQAQRKAEEEDDEW